jgi:hypothetical protein
MGYTEDHYRGIATSRDIVDNIFLTNTSAGISSRLLWRHLDMKATPRIFGSQRLFLLVCTSVDERRMRDSIFIEIQRSHKSMGSDIAVMVLRRHPTFNSLSTDKATGTLRSAPIAHLSNYFGGLQTSIAYGAAMSEKHIVANLLKRSPPRTKTSRRRRIG